MAVLKPFQDDGTSIGIGGFTIENGTDRIAVYGQTDITRDQAGLRVARERLDAADDWSFLSSYFGHVPCPRLRWHGVHSGG
jgi:hypothetical protein